MMNTSGMPFRDHAGSMVCEPLSLHPLLALPLSSLITFISTSRPGGKR